MHWSYSKWTRTKHSIGVFCTFTQEKDKNSRKSSLKKNTDKKKPKKNSTLWGSITIPMEKESIFPPLLAKETTENPQFL